MALLVLGGIGSAAFHPPAASMTANAGGTDRGGGMRLSVFAFGGAIGYASGPLIAVGIVSAWGLRQLWVAMIPILLFAPLLLRALPRGSPQRVEHAAPVAIVPLLRGPLGLVFLISTIAAFVHRTFMTMQPIALAEAGRPESTGAFVLSLYLASEAVGSLTGGVLVSRVSRQQLLLALTALSLPAHIGAVALPAGSPGALASTMVAGFLNMAVLPPIVLTAQQLVPGRAAASSGIVMGLAWATGSIGVFGAGALGDVVGPRSAALFCFPVLLLAMAAALHPSLGRLGRQPG
jgi:FSR family fosmidomycin resistance protein-like MFS transporter